MGYSWRRYTLNLNLFLVSEIVTNMETLMTTYIKSRINTGEVQYGHMSNVAGTVLDYLKKINFTQHKDIKQRCEYLKI